MLARQAAAPLTDADAAEGFEQGAVGTVVGVGDDGAFQAQVQGGDFLELRGALVAQVIDLAQQGFELATGALGFGDLIGKGLLGQAGKQLFGIVALPGLAGADEGGFTVGKGISGHFGLLVIPGCPDGKAGGDLRASCLRGGRLRALSRQCGIRSCRFPQGGR